MQSSLPIHLCPLDLIFATLCTLGYQQNQFKDYSEFKTLLLELCFLIWENLITFLRIFENYTGSQLNNVIIYTIAVLTFKTLQCQIPSYLFDQLTPVTSSSNSFKLRSSTQALLSVPRIDSSTGRRSFSYSSPTVWNSLPLNLRLCSSLPVFCSRLKTHLYPP